MESRFSGGLQRRIAVFAFRWVRMLAFPGIKNNTSHGQEIQAVATFTGRYKPECKYFRNPSFLHGSLSCWLLCVQHGTMNHGSMASIQPAISPNAGATWPVQRHHGQATWPVQRQQGLMKHGNTYKSLQNYDLSEVYANLHRAAILLRKGEKAAPPKMQGPHHELASLARKAIPPDNAWS